MRSRAETTPERLVREALDALGIAHEPQVKIGPWTVDFLIRPRLVIEVDGDYWHSLPEVVEKDRRKDEWMHGAGYGLIRIREAELIEADPLDVIRKRWGDYARSAKLDPGTGAL